MPAAKIRKPAKPPVYGNRTNVINKNVLILETVRNGQEIPMPDSFVTQVIDFANDLYKADPNLQNCECRQRKFAENIMICFRGKKHKRFTKAQVAQILADPRSIRIKAQAYKASPSIIQQIMKGSYVGR
jgi:hypothetical protein